MPTRESSLRSVWGCNSPARLPSVQAGPRLPAPCPGHGQDSLGTVALAYARCPTPSSQRHEGLLDLSPAS